MSHDRALDRIHRGATRCDRKCSRMKTQPHVEGTPAAIAGEAPRHIHCLAICELDLGHVGACAFGCSPCCADEECTHCVDDPWMADLVYSNDNQAPPRQEGLEAPTEKAEQEGAMLDNAATSSTSGYAGDPSSEGGKAKQPRTASPSKRWGPNRAAHVSPPSGPAGPSGSAGPSGAWGPSPWSLPAPPERPVPRPPPYSMIPRAPPPPKAPPAGVQPIPHPDPWYTGSEGTSDGLRPTPAAQALWQMPPGSAEL